MGDWSVLVRESHNFYSINLIDNISIINIVSFLLLTGLAKW
jgi:hypothetical protein